MASTKRTRGKDDQDIRARILGAALRLFCQLGFDGASLSAIAKEAGVAQPHTYYYFENKYELWKEAIAPPFNELMRHPSSADDLKDLTPLQSFRVQMRRMIGAAIDNLEIMHIYIHESRNPGPRLDYLLDQYFTPIHSRIERGIREISDEAAPNPVFILSSVIGATHFFFSSPALLARVHSTEVNDTDVRAAFIDFVIDQVMHASGNAAS